MLYIVKYFVFVNDVTTNYFCYVTVLEAQVRKYGIFY